jgi:uncharacterized zinc-type alcohol dehydrogenase-like protein
VQDYGPSLRISNDKLYSNKSTLISGEKAVGGSPIGGPADIMRMLDFCQRHAIEPVIEEFPISRVNEAIARLESGKARYRIVLRNDFK